MKKISTVILALMLLLPAVAHAGPDLKLNTRTRDFGPVKQGKQLKFDFKLTNVGDEDLIIEKLKPN
jgi:hypothetical protein